MFRIRSRSWNLLARAVVEDFVKRVHVHLGKSFPAQYAELGADRVTRLIYYGIERAATHGITAERGVCIYVDLMFAFVREFDRDPAVLWASAILARENIVSQRGLASCLLSHALDHRHEARGITLKEALL